jgi:hypothetical protein
LNYQLEVDKATPMGRTSRGKSVDTPRVKREKGSLRRPRPYLSRTQADVEREWEMALARMWVWLGVPEVLRLQRQPDEVRLAFWDTTMVLFEEAFESGWPKLKRKAIPHVETLLDQELAIEIDGGFIEFPHVTGAWREVLERRAQDRARQAKKRRVTRESRGVTRDIKKPQQNQATEDGSQLALLPDSGIRKRDLKNDLSLGKERDPRGRETHFPPGFARYWAVVPHKKGKAKALEAWKKHHCEPMADRIVAKVEQLKAEDNHWLRGFVPHPTTWLNAGGWDDEPIRDVEPPSQYRMMSHRCDRCHEPVWENEEHQCRKALHS